MYRPIRDHSAASFEFGEGQAVGGGEGTALISGSFEVLIGKRPQKAELISNLEL